MNKKAKIIIAALIFIFLGLIIYAFAAPNDEESLDNRVQQVEKDKNTTSEDDKKSKEESKEEEEKEQTVVVNNNNNTEGTKVDELYNKALELVKKVEESLTEEDLEAAKNAVGAVTETDVKELEERLSKVTSDLDTKDLVEQLEQLIEESENNEDIEDSRDFNTEKEIEELIEKVNNAELKKALEETYEELSKILNDTEAPKVNIEDGLVTNAEEVEVKIEDDTKVTILLDDEEVNDLASIEAEGTYTLVITDEAFNETRVTFTIDRTAPVVTVKTSSVGTNGIYSVIDYKITDNVELEKAVLNDNYTAKKTGNSRSLNFKDYGTKYINGENTWVVYDKAGNTTTVSFTFDNVAPALKDSTANIGVTSKTGDVIYVTNGNRVNFTGFINEKLQGTPTFKLVVGDTEYEVTSKEVGVVNSKNSFFFMGSVVLKDTMTLEDGDLSVVISNVKDLAGNVTNEIVMPYKECQKVIVDRTNPVIAVKLSSVGTNNIYSVIDLVFSDNNNIVKTVTNGKEVNRTPDKGMGQYFSTYSSLYVEGENTVTITDAAGNETSFTFTLDTTAPVITLKDSSVGSHDVYTKPDFKLYDNVGIAKVVVNGSQEFVESFNKWGDFNYGSWINYVNGENTITLYDAAGNKSDYVVYIDLVKPSFEVKSSSVGDETRKIFSKLDLKLIDDKGVVKVSVNGNEFERTFSQYSDLNFENAGYVEGENTVILTDAAGNTETYTFKLDTVKPVLTIKDETKSYNNVYGAPSLKLYDNVGIAKVTVNGTDFAQGFNQWGDLNYGPWLGYHSGLNTVVLTDAAGNTDTLEINVDLTAPVLTIKSSSVGSENIYSVIDLGLYDETALGKVVVNGTQTFNQSANKWGDLNYGGWINYIEGENTVELFDKLGNSSKITFTIDRIAPVVNTTYETVNQSFSLVGGVLVVTGTPTTTITSNEDVKIKSITLNGVGGTGTIDSSNITNYDTYSKEIVITVPELYNNPGKWDYSSSIVLMDKAGNTTEITEVEDLIGTIPVIVPIVPAV